MEGYGPTKYVRLTFMPAGSKRPRTIWALPRGKRGRSRIFEVTNKEGDVRPKSHYKRDGTLVDVLELVIVSSKDVVKMEPARMNLHYGWLEVVRKVRGK